MKKAFIIFIGIFFFSCTDNTTYETERNARNTERMDENIETGSGEEVSPQLDMQGDTAAFNVDTVTTTRRSYH